MAQGWQMCCTQNREPQGPGPGLDLLLRPPSGGSDPRPCIPFPVIARGWPPGTRFLALLRIRAIFVSLKPQGE